MTNFYVRRLMYLYNTCMFPALKYNDLKFYIDSQIKNTCMILSKIITFKYKTSPSLKIMVEIDN